jgi:hypothetical protein
LSKKKVSKKNFLEIKVIEVIINVKVCGWQQVRKRQHDYSNNSFFLQKQRRAKKKQRNNSK